MLKLDKDLGRESDKLGGYGSSSKHPLERSPMMVERHIEILIIAPARMKPPPRGRFVDRRKWYDKPVISFGPGPLD
jgi:hypothetical protein